MIDKDRTYTSMLCVEILIALYFGIDIIITASDWLNKLLGAVIVIYQIVLFARMHIYQSDNESYREKRYNAGYKAGKTAGYQYGYMDCQTGKPYVKDEDV